MTRKARLSAFAKLNLGLRVLYKRPDGYHELRTVFQTISLADRMAVTWEAAKQTRVRIDGAPHIPDNLVGKAAHMVLDELGITGDVHFELRKRIPAGAGLGGGSTDAAAVLLALPVLAGRPVPEERLFEIAGKLGSDVPFFLYGGTALGLGRGEELYPLPDQTKRPVLLVAPQVHSSTAEAYRDLSAVLGSQGDLTSILLQNKLFTFQQHIWLQPGQAVDNDFEEVVFARHPELRQLRDRLSRAGAAPAAMTGSGSSIFGIFDTVAQRDQARQAIATEKTETEKTFAISFVSRGQYRSAWRRALAPHIHTGPLKGTPWPPQSLYAR